MNKEPLKIKKRSDDGNRVISLRIPEEMLAQLDKLAADTNRSRNDIINTILEYDIRNIEIEQ